MCVGEHVCALVVFVFPGHEHGWFCARVGHDDVLVVRVLRFSLGVVHMWMWCLGLGVICCSPYPAVCTIQRSEEQSNPNKCILMQTNPNKYICIQSNPNKCICFQTNPN